MDVEFPEGFSVERWNQVLTYAHGRIKRAGGFQPLLCRLGIENSLEQDSDDDGAIHELIKIISDSNVISKVPAPKPPNLQLDAKLTAKLKSVQTYICRLGYNHLGTTFFEIRKYASIRSLGQTAQRMVEHGLPIKCLEATVLALYLTAPIAEIDRITCSFKSESNGEIFRHIVLLVRSGDRWGSLGLSRRADLMDKPLAARSLMDILADYREAYKRNNHRLLKAKLGLPVPHDVSSNERIIWKYLSISFLDFGSSPFNADGLRGVERYIRGLRGGFKPNIE